jgi:hypothetical protein
MWQHSLTSAGHVGSSSRFTVASAALGIVVGSSVVALAFVMTKKVLLIEFRASLLNVRTDILKRQNYDVLPILGTEPLTDRFVIENHVSVVVVGHGMAWEQRDELINRLYCIVPETPIVTLLRRSDPPFQKAAFNCPGDDPLLWLATVDRATGRIQ